VSDGSTHDRIEGVPYAWCDLTGTVDGDAVGIAIADHPENPRYPAPVYGSVRSENYGPGWSNYFNAAFLFHEGMDVAAGEPGVNVNQLNDGRALDPLSGTAVLNGIAVDIAPAD
jgi:hypothetical protein